MKNPFKSFKQNRQIVKAFRNYLAGDGKISPRTDYPYGDSGSKFSGGTDDYLGSVNFNHSELREKSRKANFDSPPLSAITKRKTQSAIDTGIRLDPTPAVNKIGLSEKEAADFVEYAAEFNDWMGCKLQHRREQMTFFQAQSLCQTEKDRDGEYFARLYYNRDEPLPHPLQWELLDADQIHDYTSTYSVDGWEAIDTNPSGEPSDGIIKDERGRPQEYLVWINENGTEREVKLAAKTEGGRYQVLHGFSPQYSFQTRGFPSMSTILQDTKLLQDFSLANIQKAINQSQHVFAVENKDQDPTSPFDEEMFSTALGDFFQNFDPEAGTAEPTAEAVEYLNSPLFKNLAVQGQPGSRSLIMPEKGTTIKEITNTAPSAQYDMFVGSFFSFLAAEENVPVEVVLMKFGSNYSASRAALVMFWRICEVERADMDADLLSPIYEMYLAEGIAMGFVSAPGWSDLRIRQYYLRHRTIGAPMPNIDPLKESVAGLNNIATGATSFTRNAQDINGSDFRKNLSENSGFSAEVGKVREDLGVKQTGGGK